MTDELRHHGIIGQKWGVRRYQNSNGRLTPAGKQRYSKNVHPDHSSAHSKRRTEEMSDDELRRRINRLQMENQYSQVKLQQNKILRGATYVTAAAGAMGAVLTLYGNSEKLIKIGKAIVTRGGG